jgi:hypothetical protein
MIHTDEDDEFDRIAHEAKLKGQPYYFEQHPTDPEKVIFRKPSRDFAWEADAIKAAVLIEREACARICDELQDDIATEPKHCAENIRARGNT